MSTEIRKLLLAIKNKLQEPKYEKGRQQKKVVTWNDFTNFINELYFECLSQDVTTKTEGQQPENY